MIKHSTFTSHTGLKALHHHFPPPGAVVPCGFTKVTVAALEHVEVC